MSRPLLKAFFWLCVVVLTTASLLPGELLPPQAFSIWDKAQHALAFGWLALFGLLSYPSKPATVTTSLLLHGGVIELAQAATGWRYGEWADLAADAVGILAVVAVWWVFQRLKAARP